LPGRQALPVPVSPGSLSTDSRLSQLHSLLAPVGWTPVGAESTDSRLPRAALSQLRALLAPVGWTPLGSDSLLYRDCPLQALPFTIGLAVLDVVASELLNL